MFDLNWRDPMDLFMGVLFLVLIAGCIALLCGLIYVAADTAFVKKDREIGAKVFQHSYTPSHTSTGVGPAIGGNGGIAVTSSYKAEEWTIILKLKDGDLLPYEVSKKTYAALKDGDKVTIHYGVGRFSGDMVVGDLSW